MSNYDYDDPEDDPEEHYHVNSQQFGHIDAWRELRSLLLVRKNQLLMSRTDLAGVRQEISGIQFALDSMDKLDERIRNYQKNDSPDVLKKYPIQIKYSAGSHGLYGTYDGSIVAVDHEPSHEEAVSWFEDRDKYEFVSVHSISHDPFFLFKCPHCGSEEWTNASYLRWRTTDNGVLQACCWECNQYADLEKSVAAL